jgi:hypothetical protein
MCGLSGRPSRKVTHHKTGALWHDNIPGQGQACGPAACCRGRIHHHRRRLEQRSRLPSVTPRQRDGMGMTVHVGPFGLSMWCNGRSEGSSGDCCQAALACIRAVVPPTHSWTTAWDGPFQGFTPSLDPIEASSWVCKDMQGMDVAAAEPRSPTPSGEQGI